MMRHRAQSPPTSGLGLAGRPIVRRTMATRPPARRAWVPVLIPGDDDVMRTKFGGRPYIPAGREWPLCPVSGHPLLFLCQIMARGSPLAATVDDADTMLQFFARADAAAVDDDPHGNVLTRAVRAPDRHAAPLDASIPHAATLLESATVARWEEQLDYPGREEPHFTPVISDVGCTGSDADEKSCSPAAGIKIGGWPYWVRCARRSRHPQSARCL